MPSWPLLAALLLATVYATRAGAREEGLLNGMWGLRRGVAFADATSLFRSWLEPPHRRAESGRRQYGGATTMYCPPCGTYQVAPHCW